MKVPSEDDSRSQRFDRRASAIAACAFFGGSAAISLFFIAIQDGIGSEDLAPFLIWSVPATATIWAAFRLPKTLSPRLGWVATVLMSVVGVLAWAFAASLALGPAWLAFSFPVLLIWISATVTAWSTVAVYRRAGAGRAVATALVCIAMLFGGSAVLASTSEEDILICLPPKTTREQSDEITHRVLEVRDGDSQLKMHGAVKSTGRIGDAVRVRLTPWTSEGRRQELKAQIQRSGSVRSVHLVPPLSAAELDRYHICDATSSGEPPP